MHACTSIIYVTSMTDSSKHYNLTAQSHFQARRKSYSRGRVVSLNCLEDNDLVWRIAIWKMSRGRNLRGPWVSETSFNTAEMKGSVSLCGDSVTQSPKLTQFVSHLKFDTRNSATWFVISFFFIFLDLFPKFPPYDNSSGYSSLATKTAHAV